MTLTKTEIEMLKEALQFGVQHIRDGNADHKQREAKISEMQALSRKLTTMSNDAE